MVKKAILIALFVMAGLAVASGLGVLIWWAVDKDVEDTAPSTPLDISEPTTPIISPTTIDGDGDDSTTPGTGNGDDSTTPGTGDGDGSTTLGTGDGDGSTTPGTGDGDGSTTPGTGDGDDSTTPGTGDGGDQEGDNDEATVVELEGEGIGDVEYTAAFTRLQDTGDMFWWFYPTEAASTKSPQSLPLILWLDGVTGVPSSLLANFGMFGPYDINFKRRENSWVEQYNLLFMDAPLGTGFSTPLDKTKIPKNIDENAEHLAATLESFFTVREAFREAPLYIFGQAHGAQSALALAEKLSKTNANCNLRGVVLGNGIISPALTMTKLGFYLEELGYIDGKGRAAVETLSTETNTLVNNGDLAAAFDKFISLGNFINDNAGAVAVNLEHIVEKLNKETSQDYFSQRQYLRSVFKNTDFGIMDNVVAPALGIPEGVAFDAGRDDVIEAFKSSFMTPAVDKVEYILQNTELKVIIYNGNLDAVSNTPGQLEWVDNLEWPGQAEFKERPRETLVINRQVEGYFRNTTRLHFYWVNAAGQSAPLDSPRALNTILSRILN